MCIFGREGYRCEMSCMTGFHGDPLDAKRYEGSMVGCNEMYGYPWISMDVDVAVAVQYISCDWMGFWCRKY